jgi:hypothetical protein
LLLFSVVSELNMNVDHQDTKHPVLGQHTLDYTSMVLEKASKNHGCQKKMGVASERPLGRVRVNKFTSRYLQIPRSTLHNGLHSRLQGLQNYTALSAETE